MQQPIRQRGLELHLPANSELRSYLAEKSETGSLPAVIRLPELVQFCDKFNRWPRTLLLMPPIRLSAGSVKRVIPPLGLSYIAAYLEVQNIPCELVDCVVEGLDNERQVSCDQWDFGLSDEQILDRLTKLSPEILAISIIYSSDLPNLFRVAQLAKLVNPSVVVVAGGLHPTIYPREVLQESAVSGVPTIDFIIRGEGELRFADFIRNMRDGLIDKNADGLAGWLDGKLFVNPQVGTIFHIDDLPFPAYHKLPMEKYFEFNVPFSPFPKGQRVMQLYTSRGCPIGCTFCASTNLNKAYRPRSVENVIAEVEHYVARYQIDEIQFADDNLTLDRARAAKLFTQLKAFGLPWCTPNGIMVNTLSQSLVDLMIDSGMYQITLSLDSGSAKTLRYEHRKPVDLTKLPDLMHHLQARNVLIHGTLVIGMPNETMEDIEEGFALVETLPFNSIGVFIAQAIPGSELYERAVAAGTIDRLSARVIDTSRSRLALSNISTKKLELAASDFLYRYNRAIRDRDPDSWDRKYGGHADRLARICVGKAAPNSDGVIAASIAAKSAALLTRH